VANSKEPLQYYPHSPIVAHAKIIRVFRGLTRCGHGQRNKTMGAGGQSEIPKKKNQKKKKKKKAVRAGKKNGQYF
jgi:hypothetical protein